MRIYNATNSQISFPYMGTQRIDIAAHSISGNIGATADMLSLLVNSYTTDEIAIVVSGPHELSLCASTPLVVNFTVQTIEEAVERFVKKEEPKSFVEAAVPVEEPAEAVEEDCCDEAGCECECDKEETTATSILSDRLEEAECEKKSCDEEQPVCGATAKMDVAVKKSQPAKQFNYHKKHK